MKPTDPLLSVRRSMLLAATLLFLSGLLYFLALDPLDLIELRLLDTRWLLRGPTHPTVPVKLVLMDEDSRQQYGMRNDMRDALSNLIDSLCLQGARAIGLDLYFVPSGGDNGGSREKLAESIRQCGRVVAGFNWRIDMSDSRPSLAESVGRRQLLDASRDRSVQVFSPEKLPAEAVTPDMNVIRGASSIGFFSVVTDPFGRPRKVPAVMRHDGGYFFPFSLAVVKTALGSPDITVRPEGGTWYSGPYLGDIPLHPDPAGYLWLWPYGDAGGFETVFFNDVSALGLPENFARDAVVLIGVSGRASHDVFNTVFDAQLPGVALHATLAANALENRLVWRDNLVRSIEVAFMAACALFLGLVVPRLPPVTAILTGPALLAVTIAVAQVALVRWTIWFQLTMPLFNIALIHVGLMGERIRRAERAAKGAVPSRG